jgi:hypothetical protein
LLHYARHFGLLTLFSAALATPGWRAQLGIAAQFALFGALHAAALVLSIRACAGVAAGRRLLFVALAAMLALATARFGLFGLRALSGAGGWFGPFVVVTVCAGLGALAYGELISGFLANGRSVMAPGGVAPLAVRSLALRSLGCAAATCASFAIGRALHAIDVLWLTIPWWFVFSGLLWYAGRRGA